MSNLKRRYVPATHFMTIPMRPIKAIDCVNGLWGVGQDFFCFCSDAPPPSHGVLKGYKGVEWSLWVWQMAQLPKKFWFPLD